jgi:hypothetical protein
VTQTTVSEWERGKVIPTVATFGRPVAVLGPWPLLEALLSPDPRIRELQVAEIKTGDRRSASSLGACI